MATRWPLTVIAAMPLAASCQRQHDPPVAHPKAQPAPVSERYLAEEQWSAQSTEHPTTQDNAMLSSPEQTSHDSVTPPSGGSANTSTGSSSAVRSGPTEAEFRAWDRKDPEGEKRLYKWDKAHFSTMRDYFHDLECFRRRMIAEGEKAFGAAPGSKREETWYKFKLQFIHELDQWQKQLFASEPRIFEKSKFIGYLLEGHELVMVGIPMAYNQSDANKVTKTQAHWAVIEAKFDKYARMLGEKPSRASDAHCKALAKP